MLFFDEISEELFSLAYPRYVDAMTKNSDYYLSDLELRVVCRCRRKSVAVATRDPMHQTLVYHSSSLSDETAAIAYTSIRVGTNQGRVRSHFEKLAVQEL